MSMVYPKTPYSEKPTISIVIQCHNDIENLPNSIKSIFNQGISDFEIIIVDIDSGDNTWNWLAKQANDEKRIRIFKSPENDTESSLNFAIKQCRGKYIAFLDPRDEWIPMKLLTQYEYLEKHKNVIMCFSNYAYTSNQENKSITHLDLFPCFNLYNKNTMGYYTLDYSNNILFSENTINISTVFIRRNTLLSVMKTDQSISYDECDLWCRASKLGDIAYNKKYGAQYIVNNDSNSKNIYSQLLKLNYIINTYSISTNNNSNLILIKYKSISNNDDDTYCVKADTLFSRLTHRIKTYN